mmetsp:Transcript_10218/g.35283  ORF Transcript_10218/g.35283 Transcript_10218/m.35283 type:complete len:91 (-) Transcript_10218:458-730(-)
MKCTHAAFVYTVGSQLIPFSGNHKPCATSSSNRREWLNANSALLVLPADQKPSQKTNARAMELPLSNASVTIFHCFPRQNPSKIVTAAGR